MTHLKISSQRTIYFLSIGLLILLGACARQITQDPDSRLAADTRLLDPASPESTASLESNPPPSETPEPTPRPLCEVILDGTGLYSGPGNLSYRKLEDLALGSELIPLGQFGDFARVEVVSSSQQGYVWIGGVSELPDDLVQINRDDIPWVLTKVIDEDNPLTIENRTENVQHYPIVGSSIYAAEGDLRIHVTLQIDRNSNRMEDGGNALYFENALRPGTPLFGDQSKYRAIVIVYQYEVWSILYQAGTDFLVSESLNMLGPSQTIDLDVRLTGQEVRALSDDKLCIEISLPDSLYEWKDTMGIVIQVDPQSKVEIKELTLTQEPTGRRTDLELNSESLRSLASNKGITFGSEFNSWSSITDPRYLATLAREFNLLVPGGELEWGWILRPERYHYEFSLSDQIVNFAKKNDMQVRGYLLPTGNNLSDFPDWFMQGGYSNEEMLSIVDDHIETVMSHYRGRVDEWLVTAETIWQGDFVGWNYWLNRFGIDFIEHTFRYARDIDPDATLIYQFTENEGLNSQSNAVYSHIKYLVEKGVPIDGVGFETHLFYWNPPVKDDVIANMKRLIELGLDVYIMEMDVNMYDGTAGVNEEELEKQAKIYKDMIEACLDVNEEYGRTVCKSFTMWGFTDAHSWVFYPAYPYGGGEAPLILDEDYEPKPAYFAIQDVLARP